MGTFGNMHPGHGLDWAEKADLTAHRIAENWADAMVAQQCNGSDKPPLRRPPAGPLDDGEHGDT